MTTWSQLFEFLEKRGCSADFFGTRIFCKDHKIKFNDVETQLMKLGIMCDCGIIFKLPERLKQELIVNYVVKKENYALVNKEDHKRIHNGELPKHLYTIKP